MNKRTWHIILGVSVVVVAAITAATLTKPQPDDLLLRATPVADTSHWFWSGGTGDTWGDTYFWLSDHEILHPNNEYDVPLTFYRYDTHTRRDTPIPALDGFVPAIKMESLSPGGKTLAYALTATRPRQVAAAKIDAPLTAARDQQHIIPYDEERSAWMPDSKHLVQVPSSDEGTLTITDIVGHTVRSIAITPSICNRVLGSTARGHVILGRNVDFRDEISERGQPIFEDVNTRSAPARIRTYTYSLPLTGNDVDGVVRLSPDGTRVAWLCQTFRDVHAAFLPVLDTLPPSLSPYPRMRIQVFVSNLDGSKMTEVGQLRQGRDDPNFPMAIQWTPDGKAVSFAYQSKLYRLPV